MGEDVLEDHDFFKVFSGMSFIINLSSLAIPLRDSPIKALSFLLIGEMLGKMEMGCLFDIDQQSVSQEVLCIVDGDYQAS
jgi:hypothetical protein